MNAEECMNRNLLHHWIDKDPRFRSGHFATAILQAGKSLMDAYIRADLGNLYRLKLALPHIEDIMEFGNHKVPWPLSHIPMCLYLMGYSPNDIYLIDWENISQT